MGRSKGVLTRVAAAFETTYGTAPASGFFQMPFQRCGLGSEQGLEDAEILGYGRDPVDPDHGPINADGDMTVPMDPESFGVWLKAALGAPATTDNVGTFTHEFTSGGETLPSLSVELAYPEVPSYRMVKGCAVDRLSWTMERSGKLRATVGIIAQGETPATSSAAGVLTQFARGPRFNQFHGAVTLDGQPLGSVVSTELTYANNLERVDVIRSDGLIGGVDPGMAMLSGRTVTRFDSTDMLDAAISGTPVAFTFSHVISAALSLTVTVPRVFLPKPKLPIEGPRGVQASFAWRAAQQSNGDPMMTASLVNPVASY